MKKLSILFAAVALLAACSQKEDVIPQLDENAIQFSAYSSASVVTRGVVVGTADIYGADKGIGVFAFYQPKATGKFNTYKYATPDFMYNQKVTTTDDDTWTYTPIKYWPNNVGDMVSFFAYAPYRSDKAWEDMGVKTDVKAKKLTTSFVINQDVVDQEDYLFATPQLNRTKQAVDANGNKYTTGTNNIKFDFKHITSQVNLYVGVEQNTASQTPTAWTDANTTIEVQSIEFKKLSNSMTYSYDISSGSAVLQTPITCSNVKQDITLTEENFTSNKTINNQAPWTTAGFYKLNQDNSVLFLAPEKLGKVVITYEVTTTDATNSTNSSTITNIIESDMSNVTLEAGKSYKMNFLIGMNSVKIVAQLTDWVTPAIDEQVDVPANEVHGVCFEAKTAGSTVKMMTGGLSGVPAVSLVYSTDNMKTWQEFSVSSTTITLNNIGDKVYFRAKDGVTNNQFGTLMSYNHFVTTDGNVKVSGNVMYLLNGTTPPITIPSDNCFANLFMGCTSIIDASELLLPATTLAQGCYTGMFNGCTGLKTAPALPATTLESSCYMNMFDGCTSLETAPALPATALKKQCYMTMFAGCISLTLTTAPELNAQTLAESCYSEMFKGCTALTAAPVLPAKTLVSFCYSEMFRNCSNLGSVTMLATEIIASNLTNWLKDAGTSPKTVYVNSSISDANKIIVENNSPGWTVEKLTE